jgi:hypothetical protein
VSVLCACVSVCIRVCVCKCVRRPCFPEVTISMCTSQGAKSRCAYEKQRRHTRTKNRGGTRERKTEAAHANEKQSEPQSQEKTKETSSSGKSLRAGMGAGGTRSSRSSSFDLSLAAWLSRRAKTLCAYALSPCNPSTRSSKRCTSSSSASSRRSTWEPTMQEVIQRVMVTALSTPAADVGEVLVVEGRRRSGVGQGSADPWWVSVVLVFPILFELVVLLVLSLLFLG